MQTYLSFACRLLPAAALLALSGLASTAHATEVVWDGHYRMRGEFFDSLSLADTTTNPNAEAAAWHMDHRLRLRPGFRITDKVSVFTQVDALPYVQWGSQPVAVIDPVTGEGLPVVYSEALGPPTTEDGGVTPQNLQVTRLWGEVKTQVGLLRFGRMPNHWGSGMVFNAGNRPMDEYGDTVDRVQFAGQAGQVFLMGGIENRHEGLAAEKDDYRAVVASVLYETEKAALGTFHTYRWRSTTDTRYAIWIGDIWGRADLGILEAETEFAAMVGGGDLANGVNDIRTSASRNDFSQASNIIATAIDEVSIMRGRLGAFERNTLSTNVRSLQAAYENLTSSASVIRDADFAEETSNLTRAQILNQASTSVLGLANQQASQVLSLLG